VGHFVLSALYVTVGAVLCGDDGMLQPAGPDEQVRVLTLAQRYVCVVSLAACVRVAAAGCCDDGALQPCKGT
jgi:hypothetical protein